MKRHVRTHGTAALAEWTRNTDEESLQDHRRACEACAKAKQRCDGRGAAPCTSCITKSRPCVYQQTPVDDRWRVPGAQDPGGDDLPGDVSPNHVDETQLVTLQPSVSIDIPTIPAIFPEGVSPQPNPSDQTIPLQPVANPSPIFLEPHLSWDDFLGPAYFLLPFSSMPSPEVGGPATFSLENDILSAADAPLDDPCLHGSLVAEAAATATVRDNTAQAPSRPEDVTEEEEDILVAEYVPHVPPMAVETRAHMIQALEDRLPHLEAQELCGRFPSLRHLDTYMQLYFEHCHPRLPFLHVPTFLASPQSWQLVLGVVCLGSQYSSAGSKQDHMTLLQRLSRSMLKMNVRIPSRCAPHVIWLMQLRIGCRFDHHPVLTS